MDRMILSAKPLVIAAPHRPDPVVEPRRRKWLEDSVIANSRVFAEVGAPELKVPDQTRAAEAASAKTIAHMAAFDRLPRAEFPGQRCGVIVQVHDAEAPRAIAAAVGAPVVQPNVPVGAILGRVIQSMDWPWPRSHDRPECSGLGSGLIEEARG